MQKQQQKHNSFPAVSGELEYNFNPDGELAGISKDISEIPPEFRIENFFSCEAVGENWRQRVRDALSRMTPLHVEGKELDSFMPGIGEKYPLSGCRILPMQGKDGSPAGFLMRLQVGDKGAVTEPLPEMKNEISQKESFIYSLSHDLRSPLLTIEGMIDMVLSDSENVFSEKSLSMLSRVKHNSERIASMVNDLLELSRIGRYHNENERVDPLVVARQVASCLETSNRFGRINIIYKGEALPVRLSRRRTAQVFKCLIDNALKALDSTPGGSIHISAKRLGHQNHVAVTDNGIGIKTKNLEEIYLPFRRLSAFRSKPGNGMGLTLVKAIVEKNSGRVWIESREGCGTTVNLLIPLA